MALEANHAPEPTSDRQRNVVFTVDEANRCLRDIIAISTLPAVWLGAKPLRIAESLLAALDTTVAPALSYIRFSPDASEPPIEVAHFDRAPAPAHLVTVVGAQLTAWSAAHDPDEILLIYPDDRAQPLRVCVYPLGIHARSGIIAVGFDDANAPTPFHRTLLNIAANQAMVARKNAALQRKQELLYEQAAREISERKRKEATLAFLVELNATAQQLTDPAEVMRLTAERLGQHLEVDRCAYAEVEDEAVFVITGDYLRNVPSIVGRWPVAAFGRECTRLMLANESYVVVDTDHDPRIGPDDLPAYRATHIRAVICVPLHKEGKFIAAMAVHQSQPRAWTREEIDLVELVVARCWESLERARTLRILSESEQRLRFMAEAMPQKIFTATSEGEIDYCNRQWMEFAGLAWHEIAGWRWLEFVHPDDRDENTRRWKHSIATGESFEMENRFRRHDGVYRWHLTRAHAMRDAAGSIVMWIGSNTDITDIVQARETVAKSREELERLVTERTAKLQEAVEQMEEFSYSVSHDLRTPLRSMAGYARALLDDYGDKLDENGREYLSRIERAGRRMDRLTQDILTYSKISRTAGHVESIGLEALVAELVEQQRQDCPQAAFEVVRPMPTVAANEPLLTQVLSNLLGNAVKFVAAGVQPRVRIWTEQQSGLVRLWIEDNGIGIAPEYQTKIWGVFERVHPKGTYSGTGIGLAIVRKAVEKMGGAVGVESDGIHGSRFWLDLAAAPAMGSAVADSHADRRPGMIFFQSAKERAQSVRAQ